MKFKTMIYVDRLCEAYIHGEKKVLFSLMSQIHKTVLNIYRIQSQKKKERNPLQLLSKTEYFLNVNNDLLGMNLGSPSIANGRIEKK